jgi:tRNA pseudouridine38-40 synthase
MFAGRTDSGVHALGQVAAVSVTGPWAAPDLQRALNALLPADIAVRAVAEVPDDFNPRRQARRRWYRYLVENSPVRPVFRRWYVWHVREPLDLPSMRAALPWTTGERDYAAVAGTVQGRAPSTVRTVFRADLQQRGSLVVFDIEANAFLPHQVRRTVGALIAVGTGKLSVQEFAAKVEAAFPSTLGPTAPSCGLTLMRVTYEPPLFACDSENAGLVFGTCPDLPAG